MEPTRAEIHPTATVHPEAVIGPGTRIGAYSIVEAKVSIGKNCDIQDHVVIRNYTSIGEGVTVFPFAVLGAVPQHLKFKGEPTTVAIGNNVTIRESVTIHRGTVFGTGTTVVKDDAYIMAYCHIAHDCTVGAHTIIANSCNLAGHVVIGDFVMLGGMSAVTQHCRIGSYCFVGGVSVLRKDLPPFLAGKGHDFRVQGVNTVGLSRRGFSPKAIADAKKMFKIFYLQDHTVSQAIEKIVVVVGETSESRKFLDFVAESKMGIVR